MSEEGMSYFKKLFLSKLDTLSHVLELSINHFESESDLILSYRLIDDMLPFGTQVAFTCNQPHNFVLWCQGKKMENLHPEVESLDEARMIIDNTTNSLANVELDERKLLEVTHIDLSENQYLELPGLEYVNDFLIPNCYFHLVTAYNIMRMKGVPLGKVDYMSHLVSKVQHS